MGGESTFLEDDSATAALGARLAKSLKAGDLVLLEGGLGAGKTALARAIIRSLLGEPLLDVPSPSFALVQPYEGNGFSILHADLYRLADARETGELGLFDDDNAIMLVEWPERAPGLFDAADVRVALSIPKDGRGRLAEVSRK